jgi:membrane-anchored protein YejM (alkaline phosphatase superfamily)
MPSTPGSPPAAVATPPGAALRRPALLWALLHVPLFLFLYGTSLGLAVSGVRPTFKVLLWPAFVAEAGLLALVAFVVALPFSLHGRLYRVAVPVVTALATIGLGLDGQIYQALGFHINGLVVKVMFQPGALRETGIPLWEAVAFWALGAAWLAAEVWVGGRFLRRFASRRPVFRWALLVLLLAGVERVYTGALAFYGGPAVFAAGQTLPLQAPLRVNRLMARLTGRGTTEMRDPFQSAAERSASRLPLGIAPGSVRFERTPDIVLVLIESLRADFLDSLTMPRLWRRAERGAVFERHYASASSTHYSLFSLFFGLQAQKMDAIVGSGRSPLLFGALKANGYQSRLLAASSVDWMGLKRTVFGDVAGDLDTDFPGIGATRDSAMVARARAWVAGAGPAPVFLMLFFDGTHFNYTYPPRSARFEPVWDAGGTIEAARVPPELIKRRARNAAYEVDWKLDDFLDWFAARRGRAPLVFVTGDHGEEFKEHGHIGHGSGITSEQIHVPMVAVGDGVPPGRYEGVTSHIDLVPTLFSLLGDRHPPQRYADGLSMFAVPPERFVLATVGWEPRYCAIGPDLKATFFGLDAGFGGVEITDPADRPLADGEARFAARAADILRAFTREPAPPPPAAAPDTVAHDPGAAGPPSRPRVPAP